MITRLQDPDNVGGDKFVDLSEKISAALTRMSKSPPKGSPFHYAYLAPAPHVLETHIPTAATNGRKYFWNPEFLNSLSIDQVGAVLLHEAYHTMLFHCARGHRNTLWNLAIDFVVNAIIAVDHQIDMNSLFPEHYTIDELKSAMHTGAEIKGICLDKKAHGRTAEDVYNELLEESDKAKKNRKSQGSQKSEAQGGSSSGGAGESEEESKSGHSESDQDDHGINASGAIDHHMGDQEANAQEIADKIREAMANAAAMGGKLPGSVAGLLDGALVKLEKPKVDLKTMVYGMAKKIQSGRGGLHLDYKRPRRRNGYMNLGNGRITMVPVRAKQPRLTYAVCLDTSGSMSDQDINTTVSQLQTLTDICNGYVVPNDTQPYWDNLAEVNSGFDLEKVRVKGRGGTDYSLFFKDYKKKVRDVDFLVILTDGYFTMPSKPLVPVIWVVVNNDSFKAPYGKSVHLR